MLLQSHGGYIDVIPTLPDDWANGSFSGLVARGNIVVDAVWKNKLVQEICLHPRKDGDCKVLWNRPCQVQVTGEGWTRDSTHRGCKLYLYTGCERQNSPNPANGVAGGIAKGMLQRCEGISEAYVRICAMR